MKFSKKILETFIDLPKDWRELMEDVGLEVKSVDGDIMNLELLANRGDHYCYLGLATEIYGRTGTGFVNKDLPKSTWYLPLFETEPEYEQGDKAMLKYKGVNYSFEIETEKCLAYSIMPYKKTTRKSVLEDYSYMIRASGINVIDPVIDITNVVLLENGQPAHVYDADKIIGKIHIRESKKGEKAALLFHEGQTELPTGTVVIADDEKILCIGGVIGCRGAEVDENTKNILFETALFDPVSIRKTERALLSAPTLASMIFERGGDLGAIQVGNRRAKKLYFDAGWDQSGDFQFISKVIQPMVINLPGDFVRSELEIDITDDEIIARLDRYGFTNINLDDYVVPGWRVWDIRGDRADLIEELCRSIGYNNLPNKLPAAVIGSAPTASEIRKSQIDSFFVNAGFFEVFTENMYSPKHAKLSPIEKHISIQNSVDGAYAFMKNNCIVQAVELVSKNLARKNREIYAFEWGKIFDTDKNGNQSELNMFWGIINGAKVSPLMVKGLLENLFRNLNLSVQFESNIKKPDEEEKLLMPKRRGEFYYKPGGALLGSFGEVSPVLLSQFDIKNDKPIYFVLNTDALLIAPETKVKYESPLNIIPSTRDIAVSVPYGRPAGSVAEFIMDKYSDKIANVQITDVYDKSKESLRSITFALEFKGEHSTDDLNKLILEIMNDANDFARK